MLQKASENIKLIYRKIWKVVVQNEVVKVIVKNIETIRVVCA